MSRVYDHTKIEKKWANGWYQDNIFKAIDFSEKPKKYILAEFPYPSGKALHAGHMMRYTVPDIYARFLRANGYNVLFPMGYDSFGLPAENYAIKTGIHPAITTHEAIDNFTSSFKKMAYSFDWDRQVTTSSPEYYKWTQWLFLKFYEAGLAEYKESPVWWCEDMRTVLAEEEVLTDKDGNKISERGGHKVVRKQVKQWMLKITKYAQRLIDGLDEVDFPESIKLAQKNWIGKSEGAQITFQIISSSGETLSDIEVFTTRPDTIYGVTFLALAPENKLLEKLATSISNFEEVNSYITTAKNKSDLERRTAKVKSGVEVKGLYIKHPFAEIETKIPLYVADYVLNDYGTGAIMGVPSNDERDKDFAKTLNLPILKIIGDHGEMINSGQYSGKSSEDASNLIVKRITDEEKGFAKVSFKMRDWLFSRQRYWGEPIPMIHNTDGTIEPLVQTTETTEVNSKLPLVLPEVPDFSPTSDGDSPLSKNTEWVNTTNSKSEPAKRETNTMPNWAGSSWYYLRFIDPKNSEMFADKEKLKYWLPVDRYFGGSEHITLHLLYSRFWHQFLYDQGLVPTTEPYKWRMTGGLLLGPDGRKMSKSIGNVIDPMEMADAYGADALRLYISFIGPYEDTYPWNQSGVKATYKLVSNIYNLKEKVTELAESQNASKAINLLIKNITYMCEELKMNTAVSEFMKYINSVKDESNINIDSYKKLLVMFSAFAPFVSEELWQELHGAAADYGMDKWDTSNSVQLQPWPKADASKLGSDTVKIAIQVNGKVRGLVEVQPDASEAEVLTAAKELDAYKKFVGDAEPAKIVFVKNKILSIQVL